VANNRLPLTEEIKLLQRERGKPEENQDILTDSSCLSITLTSSFLFIGHNTKTTYLHIRLIILHPIRFVKRYLLKNKNFPGRTLILAQKHHCFTPRLFPYCRIHHRISQKTQENRHPCVKDVNGGGVPKQSEKVGSSRNYLAFLVSNVTWHAESARNLLKLR